MPSRYDGLMPEITRDGALPTVVVVRTLPKTMLARYFEAARPRRMELSIPLLGYDDDVRKLVILHEIGHWFRGEHLTRNDLLHGKDIRDKEEEFAHDFTAFFFHPRELKGRRPDEHQRFTYWLTSARKERILAFARKCYEILEAEARKVPDHEQQALFEHHIKKSGKGALRAAQLSV